MRALIQRVSHASVTVDEQVVGEIGRGLLVLLGVGQGDSEAQIKTVVDKIVYLRIFEDDEGKMNRLILEVGGQVLVVSQFTLYADVRRGRRPSFTSAAPPSLAEPLVERFKATIAAYGLTVANGIFGAMMQVGLWQKAGETVQAVAPLWTLDFTALVIISPILLPQHPAS
jgi:D-tyrosyl-tRNA(Tyr) deacylase